MGWLETLWLQFFRDERILEPRRYLYPNVVIGSFAGLVLYNGQYAPERMNASFCVLMAITCATHLGGWLAAAWSTRALELVVFVQGLSLCAGALGFASMTTWLTWNASTLNNVRYLPGVALLLLVHGALEVHFFGPSLVRTWHVRGISVAIGIGAELAMATALVKHVCTP